MSNDHDLVVYTPVPPEKDKFKRYDKLMIQRGVVVAFHPLDDLRIRTVVDCKLMVSGGWGSVVYCNLWVIQPNGHHIACSGKAAGYGYDKQTHAVAAALSNAGFSSTRELSLPHNSVGELLMMAAKHFYPGHILEVV